MKATICLLLSSIRNPQSQQCEPSLLDYFWKISFMYEYCQREMSLLLLKYSVKLKQLWSFAETIHFSNSNSKCSRIMDLKAHEISSEDFEILYIWELPSLSFVVGKFKAYACQFFYATYMHNFKWKLVVLQTHMILGTETLILSNMQHVHTVSKCSAI